MEGGQITLTQTVVISIVLASLSIAYISVNIKDKGDYEKTEGQIIYFDKQWGNLPTRDLGKYRYLKVEGYEFPFEIFVGREWGDFTPKFEQIDRLVVGDCITVFYYQTEHTKEERINRFVKYIDRGETSFFVRSDSYKIFGVLMLVMCISLSIVGIVLWRLKMIEL